MFAKKRLQQKKERKKTCFFLLLIGFILAGLIFGYCYRSSPLWPINAKNFQAELQKKEIEAETALEEMYSLLKRFDSDSLVNYAFPNEETSFFFFYKGELIFWSDNTLDISECKLDDFTQKKYLKLGNAHSVCIPKQEKDTLLLALINVKHNYPYENDKLNNNFANGFKLDKNIEIKLDKREREGSAIYSIDKTYLFSLVKPQTLIYNNNYLVLSSIAYILAFLIFFHIFSRFPLFFNKKSLNIREYLLLFLSVAGVLSFLFLLKIPGVLFESALFSPFFYSVGKLLASIGHLSIYTIFIFSSIFLLFFYVKNEKKLSAATQVALQLSFLFYFLLFCYVLQSLVFHSSIELVNLQIEKLSLITLWVHFLLILWLFGLGLLFFKIHTLLAKKFSVKRIICTDLFFIFLAAATLVFILPKPYYTLLLVSFCSICVVFYILFYLKSHIKNRLAFSLLGILFAFLLSYSLLYLTKEKELNTNRKIAQNFYFNNSVESDKMTDDFLAELDAQLSNDKKAMSLLENPDSTNEAKNYLNKRYFRGLWKKYELQLNHLSSKSELYQEYINEINLHGKSISFGHFYALSGQTNELDYIGLFPTKKNTSDTTFCIIELFQRRHYESYSFPDLLIVENSDATLAKKVPIARYDNGELSYSTEKLAYPLRSTWIPNFEGETTFVFYKQRQHFVYKLNENTLVVVSKKEEESESDYLKFALGLALFYLFFFWSFAQFIQHLKQENKIRVGLVARFQYTFISLFIISFFAIFTLSINFIKTRYEKLQIENVETKRSYIQRDLQEMYYWSQSLDEQNSEFLNFDLQELSYIYQTDIHVFDNNGLLIGSSQPWIFSRHLISDRMASKPFFSSDPNLNLYEQIGELDYLVSYTDFYNGDYLQIGYIAIPQFFSQENMRSEIENFSTMILQVYLTIALFAILIILLVGKKLSSPLNMLQGKLKEMQLGKRNEKIEYDQNDEIGELVAQYNRTVDELEESASLLAKSERESAWKLMARQIAHEINNPLTPMKLSLQQLQRRKKMQDDNFEQYFEDSTSMLIEQINTLSRIAGTFSNFARLPEPKMSRFNLTNNLLSVVRLFENNSKFVDIECSFEENEIFVYADPEQLMQVFNNLIKNAIQAIPAERKGLVKIVLEKQQEWVAIRISDNGSGITEENKKKIFSPKFTTKTQGLGLGLIISKNIVEEFGGKISFETEEGKGTCFTIELPLH